MLARRNASDLRRKLVHYGVLIHLLVLADPDPVLTAIMTAQTIDLITAPIHTPIRYQHRRNRFDRPMADSAQSDNTAAQSCALQFQYRTQFVALALSLWQDPGTKSVSVHTTTNKDLWRLACHDRR